MDDSGTILQSEFYQSHKQEVIKEKRRTLFSVNTVQARYIHSWAPKGDIDKTKRREGKRAW